MAVQGKQAEKSAQVSQDVARSYYDSSAHGLPDIKVGTHMVVQHPKARPWATYGIVTQAGLNSTMWRQREREFLYVTADSSTSINATKNTGERAATTTKEIMGHQWIGW